MQYYIQKLEHRDDPNRESLITFDSLIREKEAAIEEAKRLAGPAAEFFYHEFWLCGYRNATTSYYVVPNTPNGVSLL